MFEQQLPLNYGAFGLCCVCHSLLHAMQNVEADACPASSVVVFVVLMQVQSASSYLPTLQQESIQLDFAARRKAIWEGASAAATKVCLTRAETACTSSLIIQWQLGAMSLTDGL